MAMRRGTKWVVALAVVIVIGGGGTYFFVNKTERPAAANQQEQTTTVKKGNVRLSVSGTSQFQTQMIQNITAPAAGTIKTMNLIRSMPVKKGDVLLQISSYQVEENLKNGQNTLQQLQKDLNDLLSQQQNLKITAQTSGKLSLVTNLDVGSTVNKTTKIGTISTNSSFTAKLPFALEEALQLKQGDPVDLTIAAYSLTKTGTVQTIGKEVRADASGNRIVDVEINVANDGTLDAAMDVSGAATLNGREIKAKANAKLEYLKTTAFLADTSGTISELLHKNGDMVKAGELIAVVTNDTLKDSITAKKESLDRQDAAVKDMQARVDELTIKAPFDGVFSTDFANQRTNVLANFQSGANVKVGDMFGAVTSFDVMTLPIQVDELDIQSMKAGLKAEVRVDSIAGRVFQGELSQVSTVGVTSNGVTYYDAIVAVPNKDGQLKYGMTGTAEILIQDKKDVLTLPVEALQIQRGAATVNKVLPDGTKENVPVKVGIRSKTSVEIVEGLSEGDQVAIPTRQRTQNGTQQQIDQLRQQFQQQGGFPAGVVPGGGGAQGGGGNAGGAATRGGR
ncbi:HlyD family efflux transporter periplasmic adaptor subunit [Paenibacillus ginsengarvi]|uniref:HlyD family efflux transporter periplasmic adaptor subunit n=1 Tax=Paenibacillus ginsengarvi TaxID=400777 RepID=A0A3B0CIM6_9BACL|nr:HlyD family efflux transporter periplasmic adaptor subunit [Paenibacillus ginsengarvi]RKN84558.1 HlyD family efflux transporter periplasmic adaptor subunit [Paenibacillus ginsengarvi]